MHKHAPRRDSASEDFAYRCPSHTDMRRASETTKFGAAAYCPRETGRSIEVIGIRNDHVHLDPAGIDRLAPNDRFALTNYAYNVESPHNSTMQMPSACMANSATAEVTWFAAIPGGDPPRSKAPGQSDRATPTSPEAPISHYTLSQPCRSTVALRSQHARRPQRLESQRAKSCHDCNPEQTDICPLMR